MDWLWLPALFLFGLASSVPMLAFTGRTYISIALFAGLAASLLALMVLIF